MKVTFPGLLEKIEVQRELTRLLLKLLHLLPEELRSRVVHFRYGEPVGPRRLRHRGLARKDAHYRRRPVSIRSTAHLTGKIFALAFRLADAIPSRSSFLRVSGSWSIAALRGINAGC